MPEDLQEGNKKLDSRSQGFENDNIGVILNEVKNRRNERISTILRFFERSSQNDKNFAKRSVRFTPHPSHFTSKIPAFTLAEDATHVDIFHDICKPAFTLAEILITLGVIGVIAAMTLPMLAENYQRRIVETRLKRFYTTFNQALLRAVDEHGPYDGWAYFIEFKFNEKGDYIYQTEAVANSFDLYLRKYLNIIAERKVVYTNLNEEIIYYLADGSAFIVAAHTAKDIRYYPGNVEKCLRNRGTYEIRGACEFYFLFDPLENDAVSKYHYNKGLETYLSRWTGNIQDLYDDNVYKLGCNPEQKGMYCTALIQYNDWQIPKDYPRKIRY